MGRHLVYARGGRRLMHAEMTDRGRRALAELVSELRASAKLPAWDVPGIAAAISRARSKAPADEVAIALLRLSARADLKSPALLADEGPHWRDLSQHARVVRPSDLPRCPTHDVQLPPSGLCSSCEAERKAAENPAAEAVMVPDEQVAVNSRWAAKIRADLRNGKHLGGDPAVVQDEQTEEES